MIKEACKSSSGQGSDILRFWFLWHPILHYGRQRGFSEKQVYQLYSLIVSLPELQVWLVMFCCTFYFIPILLTLPGFCRPSHQCPTFQCRHRLNYPQGSFLVETWEVPYLLYWLKHSFKIFCAVEFNPSITALLQSRWHPNLGFCIIRCRSPLFTFVLQLLAISFKNKHPAR